MSAGPALLVVGEALIDAVVHPGGRREEHPGGSPANVAITLGRLGHAPTLLTCIGDDAAGRVVADWLRASGVRLHPRSAGAAATSRAVAHLDESGAASYDFDIRWELAVRDPGAFDLIHAGSISATMAPGAQSVRCILARARERALISYDPNIRPALITDPAATRADIEELAAGADIIKASDEDLNWIDAVAGPERVARRWLGLGAGVVIVTRGGGGVTAFTRQEAVTVPAAAVAVTDTVGAGDTLMGAFLAGLVSQGVLDSAGAVRHRERLHRLGQAEIAGLLQASAAAAAVTVSRAGADPPWRHELSR